MPSADVPLVSAILPAHNAAATIERALRSVLAQSYPALEVIVVDDASRDGTSQLVQQFPSAVRLIKLSENRGPSAARNVGLEAAHGEFVAFLDADDEWLSSKIAQQIALLRANQKATFAACDEWWYFSDGSVETATAQHALSRYAPTWKALLASAFVHTSAVVARREAVISVGKFREDLIVGEDQDLWIRLALAGDLVWVPEPLAIVHNRPQGHMARNVRREVECLLPMIKGHIGRQRPLLSQDEIRDILGERYGQLGRNLYVQGQYLAGASLIFRAITCRNMPLAHIAFLLHATPVGKRLKKVIQEIYRSAAYNR